MPVLSIIGLIGPINVLFNTIKGTRCRVKNMKKYPRKRAQALDTLSKIENLLRETACLVSVRGVSLNNFFSSYSRFKDFTVLVSDISNKVLKQNRAKRFLQSTESLEEMDIICSELSLMEYELNGILSFGYMQLQISLSIWTAPRSQRNEIKRLLALRGLNMQTPLGFAGSPFQVPDKTPCSSFHLVLGRIHFEGLDAARDFKKSALYFQKAVEGGSGEACWYLALQKQRGLGVVSNATEAFELFRLGARLKDERAQFELGRCYQWAKGTESNAEAAFASYEQAVYAGNKEAFLYLGSCLMNGYGTKIDVRKAAKCFKIAHEEGSIEATYNYALCLARGLGVRKDERFAFCLYHNLAEENPDNMLAQCALGHCYKFGRGVQANEKRAYEYYAQAASRGSLNGIANAGYCLFGDFGVEKDVPTGLSMLRRATNHGLANAAFLLGQCFFRGFGVQTNYKESRELFRKAARGGAVRSHHFIGLCYHYGLDAPKNTERAIHHYKAASKHAFLDSHEALGKLYFSGNEIPKDIAQAFHHFQNAAELGSAYGVMMANRCVELCNRPFGTRLPRRDLRVLIDSLCTYIDSDNTRGSDSESQDGNQRY